MKISSKTPRSRLLAALIPAVVVTALLVAWLAAGTAGERALGARPAPRNEGALQVVSRPDLHPAALTVTLSSSAASHDYLFVTPGSRRYGDTGPMIVDRRGQPVWVGSVPEGENATTFSVQRYGGRPVLTWWQGPIDRNVGFGQGSFLILDSSYRRVATVRAGNGYAADLHDFVVTPRGTALLLAYHEISRDLSQFGGSRNGRLLDNLVQEVDIRTGRVLFEWSAFDHVSPEESYKAAPSGRDLWDPYHLNSVAEDPSGDLIVSARHTWAVYKIDRETGDVVWRLGGKKSDFTFGKNARFAWQHDARWRPDGALTLFDNHAGSDDASGSQRSRGLVLRLDEAAHTATLVREYTHPAGLLAPSQGDLQNLPGGGVLIGWGAQPHLSQYDAAGRLVFDARFYETNQSYRAFLFPWVGRPLDRPAVVALDEAGRTTVYVSWNGATEVAAWRVLGSASSGTTPSVIATAAREGFETAVLVDHGGPFFKVQALDADGRVVGASALVRVTARPQASPSPASAASAAR